MTVHLENRHKEFRHLAPEFSASGGSVVIGDAQSRRVQLWQAALEKQKLPPSRVVDYLDILSGRIHLKDIVTDGNVVRLESPGKNWLLEKKLLLFTVPSELSAKYNWYSQREIENLDEQKGLIVPSHQWGTGWHLLLAKIQAQLAESAPHRILNTPAAIAWMFHKARCHDHLQHHNITVPRSLDSSPPLCYEELVFQMKEKQWRQIFIKASFGSSASGVVAYRTDGTRHQAITTVEVVRKDGAIKLFNSRRICIYSKYCEVQELIDAILRNGAHVEEWIPKMSIDGAVCDVRIVLIAGQPMHRVLRLSRHPITNLHLLNQRAATDGLEKRLAPSVWESALENCVSAAKSIKGAWCVGADVIFSRDGRSHAICELNAFGDLLPGLLWQGRHTYESQVLSIWKEENPCSTLAP